MCHEIDTDLFTTTALTLFLPMISQFFDILIVVLTDIERL